MLRTSSPEFRRFFILEFTRQIIKHYAPQEKIKLEIKLKDNQDRNIQKNLNNRPLLIQNRNTEKRFFKPLPRVLISLLKIKENPLPPRLQYLHPIPNKANLNLGKLNDILKDPYVQSIECNGARKNIIVNSPTPKQSSIILESEEIKNIIDEFSRASKIPIQEGVYKVAVGNLIFLATISEIINTKFIIRRIPFSQAGR